MTESVLQTGSDDELLSVAEAAERYQVNPKTIRRRLGEKPGPDGRRRAKALPNAERDEESGQWSIPVADLDAAEFQSLQSSGGPAAGQDMTDAERRAELAEVRLEERDRLLAEKDATIAALLGQIELLKRGSGS
jgi:hypothetical protein